MYWLFFYSATFWLFDRVFQHICSIPGITQLLIELGNSYNMQTILSLLLQQMIPMAIVQCVGDEPLHYFTLLSELLQTIDLDSTLVDTVIRFASMTLSLFNNLSRENFYLLLLQFSMFFCHSFQ